MGNPKPNVAVVGAFQNGKSTFINCLLDDWVAQPGQDGGGVHTTHIPTRYVYGDVQTVTLFKKESGEAVRKSLPWFLEHSADKKLPSDFDRAEITLWKPLLRDVNLIDTPGANADDAADEHLERALADADYAVLVVRNRPMAQYDQELLAKIISYRLPYIVIMNCFRGQPPFFWDPDFKKNLEIAKTISAQIENSGTPPDKIDRLGEEWVWRCNLQWFWFASGHLLESDRDAWEECERDIRGALCIKNENELEPSDLVGRSRFLPLRSFFSSRPWGLVHGDSAVFRARLSRVVKTWQHRFEQQMDKILEGIH